MSVQNLIEQWGGLIAVGFVLTIAGVVYVIDKWIKARRVLDPAPTELERFRAEMERFVVGCEMEAELQQILREHE